jgi:hypothetical protein
MVENLMELDFEARYYLAESNRLKQAATAMFRESDDLLERAVRAWERAKEVRG